MLCELKRNQNQKWPGVRNYEDLSPSHLPALFFSWKTDISLPLRQYTGKKNYPCSQIIYIVLAGFWSQPLIKRILVA